jgi:hypothetical protein
VPTAFERQQKRDLLPHGQYINFIYGKSGVFIDSIRFCTAYVSSGKNTGNCSPIYGGSGGQPFNYQGPPGYEIVGLFGQAGKFVDAVGVTVRKRPEM